MHLRLLLALALLAVPLGCAKTVGPSPKTPAKHAKKTKKTSSLLGKRFVSNDKTALAALKLALRARRPPALAVSSQDKGKRHWVVGLIETTCGPAPKPRVDKVAPSSRPLTCDCDSERREAHVVALRKQALAWVVVGHYRARPPGKKYCNAQIEAKFGDRNANKAADVVLDICGIDYGVPVYGTEYTCASSLWEFGPASFVRQLDLGVLHAYQTHGISGRQAEFVYVDGAERIAVGDAVLPEDGEQGLEGLSNCIYQGEKPDDELESFCSLHNVSRYRWSKKKKAWVSYEPTFTTE
jgi:hypothetical protein